MSVRVVRLPDVGEGIAEAELVEWHVAVGDRVTSETVLADVMTDKATVEISAPVAGTITFITGAPGDVLSVGSDLVGIETDAAVGVDTDATPDVAPTEAAAPPATPDPSGGDAPSAERPAPDPVPADRIPPPAAGPAAGSEVHHRPVAAPAVRRRAQDLGIDLRTVRGTGPAGRITHADLDAHRSGTGGAPTSAAAMRSEATHDTRLVGLRRKIAEKMSVSASSIPHITYVDEVDVTAVEEMRAQLNREWGGDDGAARLTLLPFLCRAIVRAIDEQPHVNATFDSAGGVLTTHEAVHIGIATQTANGLVVPVVRHAGSMDLWACSAEIARLTAAARAGTSTRAELVGSTITITSLGALGGLVTTPIINHPEVAIVGVNKMQVRPVWDGSAFTPRTMMNLSSSFDHRIVDGWDAATFVQRVKALLEAPALLLVDRRTR